MGMLGRLLGSTPPRIPAGGRAFVSDDNGLGTKWSVRIAVNGEDPTPRCKRIGPTFNTLVVANAYLEWVTGEAKSFEYPAGAA